MDLICAVSATSCSPTLASPTFFTAVRLTDIQTRRRASSAAGWTTNDTVTLTQAFLNPGNGTDTAELWLASIARTGTAPGSSEALPAVTFHNTYLNNRVDPGSGEVPLSKPRIDQVANELGNQLTVTYGHGQGGGCTAAALPAPATNTKECFPRWWTPAPGQAAKKSWFHKYVVKKTVSENLPTGAVITANPSTESSDPMVTYYDYLGDAAWHHDDDVNAPDDKQSWSDWRGYARVDVRQRQVLNGTESNSVNRTWTRYNYYRGMHGDQAADGSAKAVTINTVEGGDLQDTAYLRGRVAEMIQYSDNDGSTIRHRTYSGYAAYKTADTVEHTGFTSRDAYHVTETDSRDRWIRNDGTVRKTKVVRTVYIPNDPLSLASGVVTQVEDQGDESVTTDTRCTQTDYVWNSTGWMIRPARTRSYTGACGSAAIIARQDHSYDQQPYASGESSTLGNGEETATDSYTSNNTSTKITTGAAFDRYGRQVSATDGNGKTAVTTYTPDIGIATTITQTSPSLGGSIGALTGTTTVEYRRNLPTQTVNANGKTTSISYDGLGRPTGVWMPGQQPSSTGPATLLFSYLVSKTVGSKSKTQTLQQGTTPANAVYALSSTLVDGLGRTVQTQTTAPNGSDRIVDLVMYDDRGLVRDAATGVAATGAAGVGYLNVDPADLIHDTRSAFDRLNRVTSEATLSYGVSQFATTTSYDLTDSTVTPPFGGKTVYARNVRGLTTGITEYLANGTTVYATSGMGYNDRDELATITSPNGKVTTFVNDWLGRRTSSSDPDAGASSQTYDGNSNITATTDARNTTVGTDYDVLNRPVRRYKGTTDLATWAYDTATNGKGLPASNTAKIVPPGGSTALNYTQTVTGYDADARPAGTAWSVPAGFGIPSAQSYTESYSYDPAGHITSMAAPAIGGLPAETVTAAWTGTGRPSTLASDSGGTLVAATSFDLTGRLTGRQWSNTTSGPKRVYGYDAIDRLASVQTKTGSAGVIAQDDSYVYSGVNLARIKDSISGQRECYAYDDVRRLSHAWTTGDDCTSPAAPNRTFGPGPYDQTWTFDKDNSILTFADAAATGGATSTTYSGYATAGKPAHAAITATTTGTGAGTITSGFDPSGYLTASTPSAGSVQTLTWDDVHQLTTSVTGSASTGTTNFAYTADGTRLIRQTPSDTTLTLGTTDVVFPSAGGTATGRRTYTLNQTPVALRTSTTSGATSLAWLAADDQATTDISINASDQAVTRTRYTPYGKIRATTSGLGSLGTGLPTDKSYLGKTFDSSTGLSELGARYYQAGSGIFTAPDPLIDPTHPRTTSPYTYAAGNPITYTDPSGLCIADDTGNCYQPPKPPKKTQPPTCTWCKPDQPLAFPLHLEYGSGQPPGPPLPSLPVVAPHQGCGGFLSCMGPMAFFVAGVACVPLAAQCLSVGAAAAAGEIDFVSGYSLGATAAATAAGSTLAGARLLASGSGAETAAAKEAVAGVSKPTVGQKLFRVYGGDSKAGGASWSPIDPRTTGNYRDIAGLPSGGASGGTNTGQFVIEGTLRDPSAVVRQRNALPLDGMKGGLPEYIVPNWMDNGAITVDRVSGVNPEF